MQGGSEEKSTSWPLGSVSRGMDRRKGKRKHKRGQLTELFRTSRVQASDSSALSAYLSAEPHTSLVYIVVPMPQR